MLVSEKNRGRRKDAGKREAILQAARDLFMANGFSGTSMGSLATAAGVSKATLYSHFADKEALYRAIIEGKVQDYRLEDFSDRLCGDMQADLQLIGESLQDLIYDDEAMRMLRMVLSEAQHGSALVKLFDDTGPRQVFARIAAYFEACKANGDETLGCPQADAELFTSLVMGHKRFMQALMGVEKAPNAAARKTHASDAVSAFMALKR